MALILSIISFLISAAIVYWLFKHYGFLNTYVVSVILQVISGILQNWNELTGVSVILTIIISVIVSFISTGLEYFVYNRTNSFWGFIAGVFAMSLAVAVVIVLISFVYWIYKQAY